jgi:DnaJ-class molecular chaperone
LPTLAGKLAIKMPPGMQPGSRLRLHGKGPPRFAGHGDLYVRVALRVLEHLTAEERRLYERLRALRPAASA